MFRVATPPAVPFAMLPEPVRHAGAESAETSPDISRHLLVQRFADDVVDALRGGGPVVAPVVLSLFPSMREWPAGLPIELHNHHRVTGRVYGGGPAAGDADPIHVKAGPDGSFLAAYPHDTDPAFWLQCGDHADSLFEAVLAAVELRNGVEHRALIERLKGGATDTRTDAQWLRVRLAEQIETRHPPLMHALETLAAPQPESQDNGCDGARLQQRGKPRLITANVLLEILKEREAPEPRSPASVAEIQQVRPGQLETLVNADWTLKAKGEDMLEREARGRTVPVTPGVLRMLADLVAHRMIGTESRLRAAAKEHRLSYTALRALLNPKRGLTHAGTRFLGTPWSSGRAAIAHAKAKDVGQDTSTWEIPIKAPEASGRTWAPVTAELVLHLWKLGRDGVIRHGGHRGLAALHRVAFSSLAKHVSADGSPKPKGAQLIRAKFPEFDFDEKNPRFPGFPPQASDALLDAELQTLTAPDLPHALDDLMALRTEHLMPHGPDALPPHARRPRLEP